MRGTRGGRRWVGLAVLGALAMVGGGCVHPHAHQMHGPPIEVPPPGAVPVELGKVTLPPYVIEAPDVLLVEVILRGLGKPDDKFPLPAKEGEKAQEAAPDTTRGLPVQPISGQFNVRPDGSIGIGFWGNVPVAGLTLDQAADTIRQYLASSDVLGKRFGVTADKIVVIVDVLAYNSKRYYVILDGGGYGEQAYPFPIYGSETVLDAISNVNGLHAVASKRNIWVARRTPHPGQPWQILPVDWVGITQHGVTVTNYQIMPGDRIYVKAQKLIHIDTALARVISPIERLFGIVLLGSSTVNSIKGQTGSGGGQ
jgi:polysaccharide export outer membrane protein